MRARGLSAAVWLIALLPAAASFAQELDLRVGQAFPVLFLPSLGDGKLKDLSSYRGKKLVLHVFASW